ncbi:MAG: TolB family protein [Dysgonomonas sp.]
MRIKFLFILLLVSASFLNGQTVEVKSKLRIPLGETGFYPILNEQGTQILFTSENNKGLKLYNLETKGKVTLTDVAGAGYKPAFTKDGKSVLSRQTSYINGLKYDDLNKIDLSNLKKEQIVRQSRDLKNPQISGTGIVVASDKKLVKQGSLKSGSDITYACVEDNNKIALYRNSSKTILEPCGKDAIGYVWPSVSPDGKKILFTCAGKGTYICDLNGNILHFLGKVNAPVWYTNDFVVGMDDKDNGDYFTSSKIIIVSADGKFRKDITSADELAMYPSVAADKNMIAYSTLKGDIYVLNISVTK